MSRRARILGYGGSVLLIVAGAICAAVLSDGVAEALGMALVGLGLVAVTSLVFLEVGLSEDRDRAREEAAGTAPPRRRSPPRTPRPRPRLRRMRGESRRLER